MADESSPRANGGAQAVPTEDETSSVETSSVETSSVEASSEGRSYAELLGLSSLVVAQPVLGAFGNSPSTFVSARAGKLDILAFALIVILAPPTALWLVERLVGLFGAIPRRWFHRAAIAGLVALFILEVLSPSGRSVVTAAVAVLVGVGATVLVIRYEPAKQFLGYLAFAPLLFLLLFVFFAPVKKLLYGSDPVAAGVPAHGDLPPIVMIVLDEFPLDSILDGNGNIDADAFPAFADLAKHATFARNNTAVAPITGFAVPAILSGVLPSNQTAVPNARDHPRSLFTLLAGDYRMRAGENVTEICPPSLCETPESDGSWTRENPLRSLLWAARGVPLAKGVGFFVEMRGIESDEGFKWLAESFGDSGKKPVLDYLHVMLPHQPWIWLPDGHRHDGPNPPAGVANGVIPDNPAAAELAKQYHMLQAAYADRLVGRTMKALRDSGAYDDSLVIVTSDHGVSFLPGDKERGLSATNSPNILWTLMLMKVPHQREPVVVDSPTASIDVLPTIVDLLHLDVDWHFDGRSIFGPPRADDWKPRSFHWNADALEPSKDGFNYVDGVEGHHKVINSRALDYGPNWDLRFWRWGEFGSVVGKEVDSFEKLSSSGFTAKVDELERFDSVDLSAPVLPTYVSGHVYGDGPTKVAVAVNGVIGGWYDTSKAHGGDGRPFEVMVPPSLLKDGRNKISIYLIDKQHGKVGLVPPRPSP